MKSIDQVKLYSLTGLDLTVTVEGTGAASAKLFASGRIYINVTTTLEVSKKITLTTPTAFRILDAYSIHRDGTQTSWQLKNDSTAITAAVAVAAVDKDVDGVQIADLTIDDGQYEFLEDDDDLVVGIVTGAFLGDIIIDTVFI